MNVELNSADLLVVAGNGAFVWMFLRLLVRPWLIRVVAEWWYPAAMNTAAVFIGLAGALAATVILGFNYENVLNGVLVALGGAVIAVGGNEVVGNMLAWYSAKK